MVPKIIPSSGLDYFVTSREISYLRFISWAPFGKIMHRDDDQESTGQEHPEGHQHDSGHEDVPGRRCGRAVVHPRPLAARTAVRGRLQPCPVGREAQDDAVPLPRLPQAVLGSHRNRQAGLEPGISGVGHGNLPVHDQPEIRVVHEAAP